MPEGTSQTSRDIGTQAREVSQAKTEILSKVNQRLMALEIRLIHQMNEYRQTMAIRLKEINDLVVAI